MLRHPTVLADSDAVEQPPVLAPPGGDLTVAIAGLALGGAERIVLDWAARIGPTWRVHLIVLRDCEPEWPIPDGVRVTRLHNRDLLLNLRALGREVAANRNPVCVCHLLTRPERDALAEGGASVVPVLHNASAGWLEDASQLEGSPWVIAVSKASAEELRERGWEGRTSIVQHIPRARTFAPGARERVRRAWRVPANAIVIGMIGAVKPQKDYPLALRVLHALRETRDAYLVILGGPIGRRGREAWDALIAEMRRLDLRRRVALPGFVVDAASCLPAFDVLLNTSHHEGLSMATLEALVNRVPVVASRVGGQGDLAHDSLTLVPRDAGLPAWVAALGRALSATPSSPPWARVSSYRLWTLAGLAHPFRPTNAVLFVTANLNAGGAQRSLVNLATAMRGRIDLAVAVTGNSTADDGLHQLRRAGIRTVRAASGGDAFDHAESLAALICRERVGTVCFWNVDPKIKLLLVKTLQFTSLRFVEVSPGPGSFSEMAAVAGFQQVIQFDERAFFRRLDHLVVKYHGGGPYPCASRTVVVPNGVPSPVHVKSDYAIAGPPRIVVNGRIAPTKFLVEIVEAMRLLWHAMPDAQLHVFGAAEPRHSTYAGQVLAAADADLQSRIFFHGPGTEGLRRLHEFDACAVLGQDQGCPNAVLEALAAGLPCVANDDGGTRELLIHGQTGLLVDDRSPAGLAAALRRVIGDRRLAARLGRNGHRHVIRSFSMDRMVRGYARLFRGSGSSLTRAWTVLLKTFNPPALLTSQNENEAEP